MDFDLNAERMEKLRASITPVRCDVPLRQVLAEDFPRDCADLPIAGGWGYDRDHAIILSGEGVRARAPRGDFTALEYFLAEKIIHEELIFFRVESERFAGIRLSPGRQMLVEHDGRRYDALEFAISCWPDRHWEYLRAEWEGNGFGRRPGFSVSAYESRREAAQIRYERTFWFDVTNVSPQDGARAGRRPAGPRGPEAGTACSGVRRG